MSVYNQEEGTVALIIDVIRCAEFDKSKYTDFMDRLITFAQNEKKNPTLLKVHTQQTIPILDPPPQPCGGKRSCNLIDID